MKLHRFVAANDQKAMFLVNQALGANALIYSTKSVTNGVEILAGLPADAQEDDANQFVNVYQSELKNIDGKVNDSRDEEIRALQSKLDLITHQINSMSSAMTSAHNQTAKPQTKNIQSNRIKTSFFKNIFKKKTQQFTHTETNQIEMIDYSHFTKMIKSLRLPKRDELITSKRIIALMGPTGIGKTTSVLKLAKRHIIEHGADTLGIITTDYNEISEKNLLPYYKNIYNFDLEFASNGIELSLVLKSMANKKLILIDTHGISQRNKAKVKELTDMFLTQAEAIACYYVLPANAQIAILDDVIKTYRTNAIEGCIMTKQDECASMQPVLNVIFNHGLQLEYVCSGQNLNTDIHVPSAENLTEMVMNMIDMNN
jgi:flagellar biosynthesis protein FlhF